MRKTLLALIASTALLTGCFDKEVKTIQTESSSRTEERGTDDVQYNVENNYIEGLSNNCQQAEAVNADKTSKYILLGTKESVNKYECNGDNNYFPNVGEQSEEMRELVVYIVLGTSAFILVMTFLFKIKAVMSGNAMRTANTASKMMYSILMFIIISASPILAIYVLAVSFQWGTTTTQTAKDNRLYKEASVDMPDFSYKNDKIAAITEYLVCVKSRSFSSEQDATLKMFKTPMGYAYKGSYDRCSVNVSFGVDTHGHEIGKTFGIFKDYNKMQSIAFNAAMEELVTDAEKIAANISTGMHGVFGSSGFDESKFTCNIQDLAAIDVYYYNARELARYKKYADDCLGKRFIFKLSKAPNITMEQIENQEITLGHRRVQICSGTYEEKNLVSRNEILEQYKACYIQNCSNMITSGSVYSCSVALNKFFQLRDDKLAQFFSLPASDPRRRVLNSASEQTVINTFNAAFSFLDKREYAQTVSNVEASIPVSTEKGQLSLGEVKDIFEEGDTSLLDSVTELDLFSLLDRMSSVNGIGGSKRFLTCAQNFNAMKDGFDCGSAYEEMQLFGFNTTVLGMQLSFGSMLHSFPEKRVKPKAGDTALAGTSKVLGSVIGVKFTNRVWAFLLPLVADGIALATDSAFGSKSIELTGNYPTYYALMILLDQIPDAGKRLIGIASTLLFVTGQAMIYLLPSLEYFMFLTIIVTVTFEFLFKPETMAIRWLVDIDSPPDRRDLDRPAIIMWFEKMLFIGINTASAFLLIPHIFQATLTFFIGDLQDYSLGLFIWANGFFSSIIATGMSILIFILIFKITASLIKNMGNYFEAMYFGTNTKHDMRLQGIDEQKAIAKAYKGKYFS